MPGISKQYGDIIIIMVRSTLSLSRDNTQGNVTDLVCEFGIAEQDRNTFCGRTDVTDYSAAALRFQQSFNSRKEAGVVNPIQTKQPWVYSFSAESRERSK